MASNADDLNYKERLRWGNPTKVYTRKRRRIEKTDPSTADTAATTATALISALPDVITSNEGSGNDENNNNDVLQPSSRTLESGEAKSAEKSPEQRLQHREEEEAEPQLKDSSPRNLEDGRDSDHVELINGGDLQEDTRGSPVVDLDGRDVAEVGGGPIGEVREATVKPVISRVEDRVRINLTGGRSRDEIRDLRRALEGELDQIRTVITKLEAKELQLTTTYNTSTINGGVNNNVGRISAIPGGGVNSHSHPQYMDIGVMNSRSLVRVNSEVGLVGYPELRPFQPPPRVAVAESNNGVAEFVEKEKRTPKANQYYTNSEFLLGKDRLPPESNKKLKPNGAGRKHSGESEQGYSFGFDKHRNQVFKRCSNVLQRLMKHKHGWVFNEPVNVEALGLHDYLDIIKHPMDLGTIKTRLSQNWYKSPREFAEDVRLVFRNAMTYNPKGHDVHVMAEQLLKIFEERWAVIETECNPDWRHQMYHDAGLPTPTSRKVPHPSPFARAPPAPQVRIPAPQGRTLDRSESMTGPADFRSKPSRIAHVGRIPVPKKPKANDPNKRDMTYEEKQRLSTNLQSLPSEKLDAIVQIIKKRNTSLSQHDDEIEVDIDSVDAETLWELDRFVTNYRKNLSKQRRKIELALQARGTARTAPVSNSAPMVAGALNNNTGPATNAEAGRQVDNASRSSSSSSSSSDSGSSSSDSDSDSSSGDGSEAGS
ncbi:transcription factor GTE3, chloroplastic-like isoform X1 [Lycium ferocissimum]|uniref:transcription factor GTE3, chloroplastic-like isoform X1 n=1 Tax=Lycium ferocissimum TaxID=112874 RepID=UPI0028164E0D|nr:transcription factor GTE3, chloroplastic-like isoform X1 [Lycium ferocissimum]XP_059277169.1 transcription factor GTE3, chloroplastic-like isoform X1 [Lycium ferocissimum]